jgi:hypothetical protein
MAGEVNDHTGKMADDMKNLCFVIPGPAEPHG